MSGETKQQLSNLIAENRMLKETVYRLMEKPSLRDRFAMAALNGLILSIGYNRKDKQEFAQEAYWFANAMMKERDNEQA